MFRTAISFPALLFLFLSFTLNVSDLEAQSSRNRISKNILPEVVGLKRDKRGCCGTSTVAGRLSAVAEEYEYSRLTGTYYSFREGIQASLMLNNKGPNKSSQTLPSTAWREPGFSLQPLWFRLHLISMWTCSNCSPTPAMNFEKEA